MMPHLKKQKNWHRHKLFVKILNLKIGAVLYGRPHRPKDKPFIERFIGTLQTECLDYHYEPMGAREMQEIIDEWIFKYENQRPHEGLGFLTPRQFESRFYSSKQLCCESHSKD